MLGLEPRPPLLLFLYLPRPVFQMVLFWGFSCRPVPAASLGSIP